MPEINETLNIPPNVEIFYPEDKREDLVKCLQLNGFLRLCTQKTGVAENTIKKYALPDSQGQKAKVDEVVKFVAMFLESSTS